MKRFFSLTRPRKNRLGFTLVEAVLSVGVISFGFLALAPLLAVGMSGARQARENRTTAQIAATLIEQAKQGNLTTGTSYFDSTGNASTAAQAAYRAQESISACSGTSAAGGPLNRLILQVSPMDSANGVRNYADVYLPAP